MKGFALTPPAVVDLMVDQLFRISPPSAEKALLDPGCGTGAFIEGVTRWCSRHAVPRPSIVGIDSDPAHAAVCRAKFGGVSGVSIQQRDFLQPDPQHYDYIVGNPPYVPITALSSDERELYRRHYTTATNRFDLYLLFFEQGLRLLKPGGRLVFITPEKFLYVGTGARLRQLLGSIGVEQLHFLDEATFGDLITYPLVTTVSGTHTGLFTEIRHRDGRTTFATLPPTAASWLPPVRGQQYGEPGLTLADVCARISCGVATGADSVFLIRTSAIPDELVPYARPTIAGRQIAAGKPIDPTHSLLLPYAPDGSLLPEARLGPLGVHLSQPERRTRLLARTCVRRKPWYAFHETPPLPDLLRPKLLCKDIGSTPYFVVDRSAELIPRHSVYYIVPSDPDILESLATYLNSSAAQDWLQDNCQRAAGDFLRLQSHVLKRLPLPAEFAPAVEPSLLQALAT